MPGNETVMITVPSAIAVTTPFTSTVAILVSLEVNIRFPALEGVKLAPIVSISPTVKSKEVVLTVMFVGIGSEPLFFKLMVWYAFSILPVTLASPIFLAVYNIFSPIKAVVLSNSPNI